MYFSSIHIPCKIGLMARTFCKNRWLYMAILVYSKLVHYKVDPKACEDIHKCIPCDACLVSTSTYLAFWYTYILSTGTLYNDLLRIARNLLETRENVKIESHPFYHIICNWFSWGSRKKIQNGRFFKMAVFQNRQFSKKICENFMDWSLG